MDSIAARCQFVCILLCAFLPSQAQEASQRQPLWQRDFSSAAAYEKSVEPNRERLRKIIGVVDIRVPSPALKVVSNTATQTLVAETDLFTVQTVRWPVFPEVFGEGLWLQPKTKALAAVVAIPDADQTPEMVVGLSSGLTPERQFARRLAESGCEVLVPVLVDRQSNRERICREAFGLGRHIIGYEVQKVLAAADALQAQRSRATDQGSSIGLAGYGEGGLLALYAVALDTGAQAALVSGYLDSHQRPGEEPLYRTVFGLLPEFGDAEIASLIAPRSLIIEFSAAPAKLKTPDYEFVEAEFERARALVKSGDAKVFDHFKFICGNEGMATGPGSDRALTALLNALGVAVEHVKQAAKAPAELRPDFNPAERQQRQAKELENYTQKLFNDLGRTRTNSSQIKTNP